MTVIIQAVILAILVKVLLSLYDYIKKRFITKRNVFDDSFVKDTGYARA